MIPALFPRFRLDMGVRQHGGVKSSHWRNIKLNLDCQLTRSVIDEMAEFANITAQPRRLVDY
jgi:hypothetical protein